MQPVVPSVTSTEYVVVVVGDTVIDAVVAPPGLHKKLGLEALSFAVSVADWPLQIVGEFTVTVGSGFTVRFADAIAAPTLLFTITA